MTEADLCYTPATKLAALIRAKKLSPVELTRTVLERIERLNPRLNAFCTVTADSAMKGAREAEQAVMKKRKLGPIHGIPFSVKDLSFTAGVKTMGGSHIFADRVPEHDAPFVRRLKVAGGILIGKTTTPEFGWKALSGCPLTGDTHNPWKLGFNTGGSSSGAGAAAAAGLGPLHQGSDGAGSIRVPASFCGVFGHKPSYGRIPQWPVSNNDYTTHNGPMTWTVGDSALMIRVMWCAHYAGAWGPYLPKWREKMDPAFVACIEDGMKVSVVDYIDARGKKLTHWDSVRPLFEKYDLLLTPSVSVPALPLGRINPEGWPQHPWDWLGWASFSYPFNFTGQPACSIPAGHT